MSREDNDQDQIPAQFQRIIQQTFELKNDIEFGYHVDRTRMTHNELLGSRAYQKAVNRIQAEREAQRRQNATSGG